MTNYKNIIVALISVVLTSCSAGNILSLETDTVQIDVDNKGQITSIYDKTTSQEYLAKGVAAPLLAVRIDTTFESPISAQWNEQSNVITLSYPSKTVVEVEVLTENGYFTLETKSVESPANVEIVQWGPYPTTISQVVGECVGVVRDSVFAFGYRALNSKTLAGVPLNENDEEPAYNIFASNSIVDIAPDMKVAYRGHGAQHTDFGSVVQAYTRNRNDDRVIPNMGHERYVAPAYNDGGVVGSKLAVFGSPAPKALDYIEKIVLGENLPYPTVKGVWNKKSPHAAAAYIIYPFNENNIEEALAFTKRTGLEYLYHAGPFATWGNFKLNPAEFPNGIEGLKNCVDKAAKEGVKLGVHTLSNFTTTSDAYVTPVPDKRLAKVGSSAIIAEISANAKEIEIMSPDFFNQMKNNTLHGVMIGDELIRYEKTSDTAPWKLLNCERGAWGTKAAAHAKGTEISKLADHAYGTFLTNTELTKEQARNLADIFNYTGLMQVSFDGLEGNFSTGMGQYGSSIMIEEWFNNLDDKLKNNINDASMTTHFNWTMFTRMNWGEPWYAGFRESQMGYRMMNQDFYRRNLMPCMLGWFKYDANTSIEDVEWLLARSAAFDAGYTLVTNPDAVANNGETERIIKAISEWENARMKGAFDAKLKLEMEHLDNEYSLNETSATTWDLTPIDVQRFKHLNVVRQPGEPVVSKWVVDNESERQPINFIIKADDNISDVTLAIGGYSTIKVDSKLKKGQFIKYDGGDEIKIIDNNWNVVKTQKVDPKRFEIDNGETTIIYSCLFDSTDNEKVSSVEVRLAGEVVNLSATR